MQLQEIECQKIEAANRSRMLNMIESESSLYTWLSEVICLTNCNPSLTGQPKANQVGLLTGLLEKLL